MAGADATVAAGMTPSFTHHGMVAGTEGTTLTGAGDIVVVITVTIATGMDFMTAITTAQEATMDTEEGMLFTLEMEIVLTAEIVITM